VTGKTRVRPAVAEVCTCRPVTVATWRNETLISIIRHHWRGGRAGRQRGYAHCGLPDVTLDPISWQPRPGAHTEPQTTPESINRNPGGASRG